MNCFLSWKSFATHSRANLPNCKKLTTERVRTFTSLVRIQFFFHIFEFFVKICKKSLHDVSSKFFMVLYRFLIDIQHWLCRTQGFGTIEYDRTCVRMAELTLKLLHITAISRLGFFIRIYDFMPMAAAPLLTKTKKMSENLKRFTYNIFSQQPETSGKNFASFFVHSFFLNTGLFCY